MPMKNPPKPGMVKCGPCEGEGYREDRDDDAGGRLVRDACYHCGTTGWIDEETALADRVESIAGELAADIIYARRDSANRSAQEDQTGEGWGFCAAENMMSEHDYTRARIWEETADVMEKLKKLDRSLLLVLLDRLDPPAKPEASEGVVGTEHIVIQNTEQTKPEPQKPLTQEDVDFLKSDDELPF